MSQNTKKTAFVFVIMPFDKSFNDLYEIGIKSACNAAGADCERVDEQMFLENILERIYNQISRADIVVAEMTGRNPNVFYEAGYAHGLGKPVILLTKSADDIPFDLRHYPHIVYQESIVTLREQLERKIRWCVQHPAEVIKDGRLDHELQRMSQHISNYLRANDYTKMTFERIRERINEDYSDKLILTLIDKSPERFRRVRLKEGKPGIGLVEKA